MGEIYTKRWDDPIDAARDGTRLLVTRYRPRGLATADETWSEWLPSVAPSRELYAAAYGKRGLQIGWESYLREMQAQRDSIRAIASRVRGGETSTLLCSTQCDRESRCHRTLLKMLIERELGLEQ